MPVAARDSRPQEPNPGEKLIHAPRPRRHEQAAARIGRHRPRFSQDRRHELRRTGHHGNNADRDSGKREWIDKERFVEGLALVNMLPGPGATQVAIFLGHAVGGIVGGILARICFIVPAFAIMLVLAGLYAAFGALPSMRNAFYGIGPVVVGIFAVAVYRLARGTMKER